MLAAPRATFPLWHAAYRRRLHILATARQILAHPSRTTGQGSRI